MEREEERDFQFGWIQITSCLLADEIYFNSNWNMQSFIDAIPQFINRTPDKQPKGVAEAIKAKSRVLYYPVQLNYSLPPPTVASPEEPIHILWNHRWEHDKDPVTFFSVLIELHNSNVPFVLSVLGESFDESPKVGMCLRSHCRSSTRRRRCCATGSSTTGSAPRSRSTTPFSPAATCACPQRSTSSSVFR